MPDIAWSLPSKAAVVRSGPGPAEARDRAVDEPRIDGGERLVPEPELVHDAAAEVLPHHVGAGHQALDDLDGLRPPEVEGDAALVAVHRQEGRRHLPLGPRPVGELAAGLVALARLDLDHVGAEERQLVGPVGPGEIAGEVEDADAGERLAHGSSRLALATALHHLELLSARSAICSGESFDEIVVVLLPARRPSLHRSGDCTVVRAAGALSRTRSASSSVWRCDATSNGRPAELPSGKSLNRKRGTPQCSTMSFAAAHDHRRDPVAPRGAGRPDSRSGGRRVSWARARRRRRRLRGSARRSSGASGSIVTRWLRLVGAP